MSRVLVELFRHHTWSTERLLAVCAGLDDEQLDATGVGTYGSVRGTLAHPFGAQGRYVRALIGQRLEPLVSEREAWPGFETLRASARGSNGALEEVAARADSMEPVSRERQGQTVELPVSLLLAQAIDHATEHRARINTILTRTEIEPPNLDGWTWHESESS